MKLYWKLLFSLDQINALTLLIEQEGIANEDLESAYRELEDARESAIKSESARQLL